jgi:hypothetical protein
VLERIGGLWHYGWLAGRYWPSQVDLSWERTRDGLRPMSADERFVTTDQRYYPAVGAMHPRPSVFIVTDPIELVLQPDLCALLSDYRVLAETPDYVIFDLTRRAAPMLARDRVVRAALPTATRGYFYRFPPTWRYVARGMDRSAVLRALGRPRRLEIRRGLRKPVETWFYGPQDKYAIVFVAGAVFLKAESYR